MQLDEDQQRLGLQTSINKKEIQGLSVIGRPKQYASFLDIHHKGIDNWNELTSGKPPTRLFNTNLTPPNQTSAGFSRSS